MERYKHSFKVAERTVSALAVYNTGLQRCESGYCWGPGVRDHYLLHYVTEGQGSFHFRSKVFLLSRGDMFLAYPHETISYQADPENPWTYCWVGFNGLDAGTLLKQTDFSPESPVLHFENDDTPHALLTEIYACRGGRAFEMLQMTGKLYMFLSFLLRHSRRETRRRYQPGLSHVRRACAFIANNFSSAITVEDVAAHVGVCRSRLYRAFQEHMEISPAQYLTRFRMEQACLLLTKSDLSIKAVAYSVGYEDPLYFSRRFREVMGSPPSEYGEKAGALPEGGL